MTQRRVMLAMTAASMLLAGAAPASAQDEAESGLPVADCEAPADSIGVAVFRFDNEYLSLIREAMGAAAEAKGATLDIVDGQKIGRASCRERVYDDV